MRGGKSKASTLVNVGGLDELRGIQRENGHVVVGSGVTIAELLSSDIIAEDAPVLRQAAEVFANPLVRNRATLGGNLGNASPAADTAPPLLVLEAEVELKKSDGSRWVPLRDFFVHGLRACRANHSGSLVGAGPPDFRALPKAIAAQVDSCLSGQRRGAADVR
jgi:carbon-monoxide dehydrogenase medium subunit